MQTHLDPQLFEPFQKIVSNGNFVAADFESPDFSVEAGNFRLEGRYVLGRHRRSVSYYETKVVMLVNEEQKKGVDFDLSCYF